MNDFSLKIIIFTIVAPLMLSCHSANEEQQNIVAEWTGREISFPEDMKFQIESTKIKYDVSNADYKIVTYVDSTNCIPCKMKLQLWDDVINEFKSIPDVNINFAMVVNTTHRKDIEDKLTQYHFLNPVCIDTAGSFDKVNHFPTERIYHTFLLDVNDKIVAIGNPVINPKIKALYKHIILNDFGIDSIYSNTLCKNSVLNLGLVKANDTISFDFQLCNSEQQTYTIKRIVPSCDCVSASIDNECISNGTSVVTATYATGQDIGAFSRYIDIYLNEKETPERLTIFGITK
jgi:hypothetical protein